MTPAAPLPPVKSPADCWDWITPEDVIRIALASFYGACRSTEHTEDGSPWIDEKGQAYAVGHAKFGSAPFAAERRRDATRRGI